MDLPTFRVQFPEFKGVSNELVQSMLSAASIRLSERVWGAANNASVADQGQGYLAAHLLATSPFGQQARMAIPKKSGWEATTYGLNFLALMRSMTAGFRVT